jgi:hypothetical protein
MAVSLQPVSRADFNDLRTTACCKQGDYKLLDIEGSMKMFDVRNELERLPDPTLYDVARNLDAASRLLAIRILRERGSEYAFRPEIAKDIERYALDDPTSGCIDLAPATTAPHLPRRSGVNL